MEDGEGNNPSVDELNGERVSDHQTIQSGDRPFRLLPGKVPLGEPIVRQGGQQRAAELAQPTLRQEINAYLEERARLREQGLLPTSKYKPPIITPADAISLDLFAYDLEIGSRPEVDQKTFSASRISWGFDALAFGVLSHGLQEYVTTNYEFQQGFHRNRPQIFEKTAQLNGEETAILAEQLQKVGISFQARPGGITIPFAPTVKRMREIVGGKPLWEIPPPNLSHIKGHPRRKR